MSNTRETADTALMSPAIVGIGMIIAAAVSVLVYAVNGHWAAGQGGIATAGFGVAGIALIGVAVLQNR